MWIDFSTAFGAAWKERARLVAKSKFEALQKAKAEQKDKSKVKKVCILLLIHVAAWRVSLQQWEPFSHAMSVCLLIHMHRY